MSTEYEKCLAGEPFVGGKDPDLLRMIRRSRKLLRQLNDVEYDDAGEKERLMRELFGHVGKAFISTLIFIANSAATSLSATTWSST